MKKLVLIQKAILFLMGSIFMFVSCNESKEKNHNVKLQYVPYSAVKVTDDFWRPKIERNIDVTVPYVLEMCIKEGYVHNFAVAAGIVEGEYVGLNRLWDETLYKAMEAASYSLMYRNDKALDQKLDSIINIIALAQDEDGYIDSHVQCMERKGEYEKSGRFTRPWSFEMYHCGHLIEAGVAHYRATGKRSLLDVAIGYADLIDQVLGPNGTKKDVLHHSNIEFALPRLYEVTGDEKYLHLSKHIIDMYGNPEREQLHGRLMQDHMPLIEQTEAVGQAPRATYLYSGAAEVSYHELVPDYNRALGVLWEDVVHRKMYITGGIGSEHSNEGFGEAYDLPNKEAYHEVCAASGFSNWNTSMFKLDQDGKFFDILEYTLYNNIISAVSFSGDRFFYPNPLASDGQYKFNLGWVDPDFPNGEFSEPSATRKEWFPCACCPTIVARFFNLIPGYIYAQKEDNIFVNLFIGSETTIPLNNNTVTLTQETKYPWEGRTRIRLASTTPNSEFTINIRIPSWAQGRIVPSGDLYHYTENLTEKYAVKVNGEYMNIPVEKGYASIKRKWKTDDFIDIQLPLSVKKVESNPQVKNNLGKVALLRGPIVYCVEAVDNDEDISDVYIDNQTLFSETWDENFDGIIRLELQNKEKKYRTLPYFAWSNRGLNAMAVWLEKR